MRPHPRRSRRSPITRSCPTATPARSWPPMGRSTGSACPASMRRACLAACLTGRGGSFRFGPFGINHPTTRIYEPGTNVLATTWKTPSGWILVRDALTIGPWDHEDVITPHTRPPADDDADHMLVRTVHCLEGRVEVELVCEPAFDYGRVPARMDRGRRRTPCSRRERRGADDPSPLGSCAGDRGKPRSGAPRPGAGRPGVLCALLGRRTRRTAGRR